MSGSLHMAGQSDAKAHSKAHDPGGRRPPGRRGGVVGFGVRFRSALAGHANLIDRVVVVRSSAAHLL